MRFARLTECGLAELGVGDDALDGPFVMADGSFGLLVSLRGKDGGSLASASELRWGRDVPPRMREEGVRVFVRRAARALCIGAARVVKRGQPAKDGFKVLFALAEPLDDAVWREIVASANTPPPPPPEEAIRALSPVSTTEDRVAAMGVFAERWFACSPGADDMTVGPAPLRALHALVQGRPICGQNRLVPPPELIVDDGKIVFYVENQGVCTWATAAEGADPPVLRRTNDWKAPWVEETSSLSAFLIELLVYEAVMAAPFSASHDGITARDLGKLARRVAPLPLPTWRASGVWFYGDRGIVGFAFANGDTFEVCLGAKERTCFEAIEDIVADWPEVGF